MIKMLIEAHLKHKKMKKKPKHTGSILGSLRTACLWIPMLLAKQGAELPLPAEPEWLGGFRSKPAFLRAGELNCARRCLAQTFYLYS